jgi:hypothetical protein
MGWAIGWDRKWKRDIGYGVPAYCDHPGCSEEIDRGLSYVCGSEPYGGEHGCGLHFCARHLFFDGESRWCQLCWRCLRKRPPFEPKPDHPEWVQFKMTDPSWAEWRASRA